jgi:pyrroline-5-carboxylate reductase
MKLAILGTGNLGKAIAHGLVQNRAYTQIILTRRDLSSLESFTAYPQLQLLSDNAEAARQSDILLLCVQPPQLPALLEEIKPCLTDKHVLISTVTGFSLGRMEAILGKEAFLIRAMPNTAIAVGQSMTCLCANTYGSKRIEIAEAIFNKLGHSLQIAEEHMQAATVICASGIAFWMRLIRASTQGAIQLGFDAKEAQLLAMHTCQGAAALLIEGGAHPEAEIDQVTTPMGCTIEGLNEMEHQGLSSSLIRGMLASFNKISEMKPKH